MTSAALLPLHARVPKRQSWRRGRWRTCAASWPTRPMPGASWRTAGTTSSPQPTSAGRAASVQPTRLIPVGCDWHIPCRELLSHGDLFYHLHIPHDTLIPIIPLWGAHSVPSRCPWTWPFLPCHASGCWCLFRHTATCNAWTWVRRRGLAAWTRPGPASPQVQPSVQHPDSLGLCCSCT